MEQDKVKYCKHCQKVKPLEDFSLIKGKYHRPYCKVCMSASANSWCKANRAKIRLRYQENKGGMKDKAKDYYQRNKIEISEKTKQKKEAINIARRKRYQKIKNTSEYKMLRRKSANNRRALLINAEGNGFTITEINELIAKSDNICFWCDCDIPKGEMHLDHIYPLSKGGKHDINNIVVSCRKCNLRKSDTSPEIFLEEILKERATL